MLQYWGLDANEVEPCCWMTYTQHRDTQEVLTTLDKLDIDNDTQIDDEEVAMICGRFCNLSSSIDDSAGRTTTTTTVYLLGRD